MNLDSIFVGEPEDERGRDFTWPSLGWVIPFTNSREPHGLRIPLWTDACDGSIFIWPNLLTVTRTGPRPSSGSPTKIFNLRCKNKKDAFLSVAREKRKSWLVWFIRYEGEKGKSDLLSPRSKDQVVLGLSYLFTGVINLNEYIGSNQCPHT